jgi:hypothetical protein
MTHVKGSHLDEYNLMITARGGKPEKGGKPSNVSVYQPAI